MPTSSTFRVLLVNAPPFEVVEPWYDRPKFGRQGLACLAAVLREEPGLEVRIIDAKLERLGFDETCRRAVAWQPHLIGFTAFTNEIKPAAHLAELIRRAYPSATLLIGGVHVTALPEATLREMPVFDLGCVGEGEETLLELCRALRDDEAIGEIAGLVLRDGETIRRTAERELIDDLDRLPPPAWDLLPKAEEYWVQTQRGCPFTCRFCMNPNGRGGRRYSVARAVADLDALVTQFRPRKLNFADEIFSLDMERTRALLDGMIKARLGERVVWWSESHVHFVDEALFRQMKEAGCEECALGIETGDPTALRTLGKGTSIPMIEEAFAAAARVRLHSIGFFIIGHPNETVASIRQTIALAVRVNPTIPIFGVMVPYPGTEVARLAAKNEGGYRLLTDDWDAFNKQIGGALEFAGLTRRQIEWLQLRAYVEVFWKNRRFADLARFGWNYRAPGLRLVRKILRQEAARQAKTDLSPARRAELAGAAEDWAVHQSQTAKRLKVLGRAALARPATPV